MRPRSTEALVDGVVQGEVALFRIAQSGLGAHPLRDVVALDEDARDSPALVAHGLVDEVEQAVGRLCLWRRLQADGHGAGHEALAGRVNPVEQLVEALSVQLGERFTHCLAHEACGVRTAGRRTQRNNAKVTSIVPWSRICRAADAVVGDKQTRHAVAPNYVS